MIIVVPASFGILIICLNVIALEGGSNLYKSSEIDKFSEDDIMKRVRGSKIWLVSEQAMLTVLWTLKCCILFVYSRLTHGTRHIRNVQWLAVYVVVGWIAVEIAFFTACRPFNGYWSIPSPDPQCDIHTHYAIVQMIFNISSDLGIFAISISFIAPIAAPLKQKLVLGVVFGMGIFVMSIVAAVLTKSCNLSNGHNDQYMLWYIREASVAVYVANLLSIWPLLREWVGYLRHYVSQPSARSDQEDLPEMEEV
ncbi:hypothetical protein P280DRAFT_410179 [Massarina eburnea CBS 473.64]|uniref:Rhodopsin domain-containing protein n=1 Tax=Massarina eburnea CBS 473.64 TaxID=1395130 RepID=A0A6A6RLD4_9PLEO|nr:hypothetical protein P280DRAFT_410179 [Massarina eburnea CBS 473.64]